MTTSPIFAAYFGWVALGETLPPVAWIGIALVIAGVAWVILERPRRASENSPRHLYRGVLLALIGSACQAGGLLLSKQGMGHGWAQSDQYLTPQAATLIRMFFAGVGILPVIALHGCRRRVSRPSRVRTRRGGIRRAGFLFATAGAFTGPYLGVWMSLVASDRAPLGVAQTLCSLTPIFILPFSVAINKEHISIRAVAGAFIAVGGAAMLFLVR